MSWISNIQTNIKDKHLQFLNELSPIISKLCKNNKNTVITGDMNLDLLKIDEREKFQALICL